MLTVVIEARNWLAHIHDLIPDDSKLANQARIDILDEALNPSRPIIQFIRKGPVGGFRLPRLPDDHPDITESKAKIELLESDLERMESFASDFEQLNIDQDIQITALTQINLSQMGVIKTYRAMLDEYKKEYGELPEEGRKLDL